MDLELKRHAWSTLQGASGPAGALFDAISDLVNAPDRQVAETAFRCIGRVVFANGLLSEASPSLASSLVHGLWQRNEHAQDLILGLLADIAGGFVDEGDPGIYGPVSVDECLREVCRGFPMYVEVLEAGRSEHARTACIDLILMCAHADDSLRGRSIYFLSEAAKWDELSAHRTVIDASLNELRDLPTRE